ncbi:MAG: hypothetical protein GY845_11135, partial [Planctomycetes bacterium]|nr:hypothetical protein [Planctomycetota bacterium]
PQNILLQLIKSDISERLRILERNINRNELRRTASEEWEELYSGRLEKATAAQATYGPHMSTTWTQSTQNGNDVFNIYTPSNWVSGCVATAGGQILKYWDWPTRGVGSYAYTPSAVGSEISADFGSTTYAWSDMLDSYSGTSTLTQRQATGLMVYHVGVSVDMEYTDSSSGTQTPRTARALKDYFRYTGEYVQGSDADFYTQLQENMENGKPAELSIRTHPDSTYSGHAIVVDGFRDADSFYHLNFGWAGSYDAWYDINPIDIYTGSTWKILNGAVLDIVPDPYFSTEVDTNTTGGYTLSWSVSSNLNAD